MKHLDYITNADVILLWFPSQNRTFLGRKPYVFGSETVRFWDGERKRECTSLYRKRGYEKRQSRTKRNCLLKQVQSFFTLFL